jgi:hypothetical protein
MMLNVLIVKNLAPSEVILNIFVDLMACVCFSSSSRARDVRAFALIVFCDPFSLSLSLSLYFLLFFLPFSCLVNCYHKPRHFALSTVKKNLLLELLAIRGRLRDGRR